MQLCNFQQVHTGGTGTEVDTQNTNQQECRTTHQHQCQLHGRVFLSSTAPYTDKQVHRNERYLIEHEHGEQVRRNEEAEHTQGKQGEPEEILFCQRLQTPGGESTGEDNDGRKQQHGY